MVGHRALPDQVLHEDFERHIVRDDDLNRGAFLSLNRLTQKDARNPSQMANLLVLFLPNPMILLSEPKTEEYSESFTPHSLPKRRKIHVLWMVALPIAITNTLILFPVS